MNKYKFLSLLEDELNEFVNKMIEESNYKDNLGNPDSYLKLASVELDDNLYLVLEYHRKYFERKTKIRNAVAGWNVRNTKDKFLSIPVEISVIDDSITIDARYRDKSISSVGTIEEDEIIFEDEISTEIESKTVDNMLQKVFNLIKIRANLSFNNYLLWEEGEYID